MKKILKHTFLVISVCLLHQSNAQQSKSAEPRVTSEDLQQLIGSWTGSLTYIDYQSNEPYTMPADLKVEQGKNENELIFNYLYPNEPKANSEDKVAITQDGKRLNKKEVTAIARDSTGRVEIVMEYAGKDNGKKAMIRSTYLLSEQEFVMRKEVQFEDDTKWFKRNEFSYQR